MTTYQKRVPIPEPMREAPEIGTWYWIPNLTDPSFPTRHMWKGNPFDKSDLHAGLCYRTKNDAIARARAMRMTEEEES